MLEESMYAFDWSLCEVEITSEVAGIFANLMLPNNLGLADPDEYAKLAGLKARQAAIADLILETGFQPFPIPSEVVVVYRDGGTKSYPKHLATTWLIFNVRLLAMKEVREKGSVKYRKAEDKALGTKEILNFSLGSSSIHFREREMSLAPCESLEDRQVVIYADELSSWMAAWVAIQMDKLSDIQVATLANLLRPELKVINDGEEIGVLASKDNQDYYFSISQKWLTTRSGRNPRVQGHSVVWMQKVDSRFCIFNLAVWLGARRYEGSIDSVYNRIPNLLSRINEDGGNSYSVQWEDDHPTRIINEDLRMVIGFIDKIGDSSLTVYPFVFPINVAHNPDVLDMIVRLEGDGTCDKYNTTFTAGRRASNAAGTYMTEDGMKRTIHDMKGTKMLNRPMQARKHLSAKAELVDKDGNILSKRIRSLFTVKMED